MRRTTSGCSSPDCLSESANSRKALSSKSFLGWFGFGLMAVIGSSIDAATVPASEELDSRAPNPRPSPCRLDMRKHLLGELQIGNGSGRPQIVEHDRLAMARRLGQPDISGDHSGEDLISQVALHLGFDLSRQAGA